MKNARKTVLEMARMLSEFKEHTDDEIVDFDQIDLQHEYDKLNTLLFDGKLQPVRMEWNTRKSAHGVVKAIRERATGKITIKSLSISKFLDVPYKVFKDTLAHEMIHVHFLQDNINANHDWRFLREMNRINSMGLGFNVSVTMDSSSFGISKHAKSSAREMVLIVVDTDRKKNMVAVTTPKVFEGEGKYIEELYGKLIRSGKYRWAKGDFYMSSNPELMKYPNQRTFKSKFSYSEVDQTQSEKLKSDAQKIGSFAVE